MSSGESRVARNNDLAGLFVNSPDGLITFALLSTISISSCDLIVWPVGFNKSGVQAAIYVTCIDGGLLVL